MPTTIEGLEALKRNVANLKQQVDLRAAVDAVQAGGEVLRRGIELRAPRQTGKLAASIVVEIHLERGAFVAKVGPDRHAFYGQFLEFGTRFRAAFPFMRPTLDEDREAAVRAMDRTFRERLDALGRTVRV